MGLELVSTKIVVLTLLGVLRLVFGLIPLKISKYLKLWGSGGRRRQVERVISLCLCFGGGVLMATCFVHMIPEVRESLDAVIRNDRSFISSGTTFPLAELFICCGFFLIYILEEIAHTFFARSHHQESPLSTFQAMKSMNNTDHGIKSSKETSARTGHSGRSAKIAPASSQVQLIASSLSLGQELETQPADRRDEAPRLDVDWQPSTGGMRHFLVIVALSFHSVFEGLAIGLQPTETDVWYLFTAVSIHACTILFCIGLELAMSTTKLLHIIIYMFVLAMVSPFGVVIGILFTMNTTPDEPRESLVVAFLQGIAGGTILYITFFEVLSREKKRDGCGILRISFILIGFSLMVALQIFVHGLWFMELLSNQSNRRVNKCLTEC